MAEHRPIRIANEFRHEISLSINEMEPYYDTYDMFYNGDWQPISIVVTKKGTLCLHHVSIYDNSISYILHDNKFVQVPTNVENFIYDIARLLYPHDIQTILNENYNVFSDSIDRMIIDEDEDRGYLPILIEKVDDQYVVTSYIRKEGDDSDYDDSDSD